MSVILSFLIRSLIWRIPGMRLFATAFGLIAAGGILLYILWSLAVTRIAKNRGVRFAWLAWLPIANLYVFGRCADDERGRRFYAWICPLLLGSAMVSFIGAAAASGGDVLSSGALFVTICIVLLAAALVYFYMALSWVYTSLVKKPTAILVLSIVFPFLIPIFLFVLREKLPGGATRVRINSQSD